MTGSMNSPHRSFSRKKAVASIAAIAILLALGSCHEGPTAVSKRVLDAPAIEFKDVTSEAGIDFVHRNGATGEKYLPETMGSGCAIFDFDNDGWLDVLLINGND